MQNMEIYNSMRSVPVEAQKKITGGRLNGMTDIKPMWRIEKLTEVFGPVGIGWKTVIKNKEIIEGANEEKIAIVDIDDLTRFFWFHKRQSLYGSYPDTPVSSLGQTSNVIGRQTVGSCNLTTLMLGQMVDVHATAISGYP